MTLFFRKGREVGVLQHVERVEGSGSAPAAALAAARTAPFASASATFAAFGLRGLRPASARCGIAPAAALATLAAVTRSTSLVPAALIVPHPGATLASTRGVSGSPPSPWLPLGPCCPPPRRSAK